jgi:hypothetical protein
MQQSGGVLKWLSLGLQLVLWVGCQQQSSMLVSVDNIPTTASSIVVIGVHDGASSAEPVAPFELPSPPPSASTLLLTLPQNFAGDLEVNLAAFDQPNGAGCLLATGVQRTASFHGPNDQLAVSLQALASPACQNSPVMLLAASPAQGNTAGGELLTLTGWGFTPDATVQIGSGEPTVTYVSASELQVQTPAHVGLGLTPITVNNPDGGSDTRNDLFRYYADPVTLSGTVISLGGADIPGNLAVGKFDPSTTNDFCVPVRNLNQVNCYFFTSGTLIDSKTMSYAVGVSPSAVATGDFNKDGALDIVVANATASTVQILLNNGQGVFSVGMPITVGSDPESVAVGDVNSDGYPDIVVANSGGPSLTILKNQSGASFTSSTVSMVLTKPTGLALGDLNGDGQLDIALAGETANEAELLFNLGSGIFSTAAMTSFNVPVGQGPTEVVLADVNYDGTLDVVVVASAMSMIDVYLNKLTYNAQGYALTSEPDPVALAYADINGDGFGDLIVPSQTSGNLDFFPNNAGTGFGSVPFEPIASGCPSPAQISGLDLNGDGITDLVTTGKGCIGILINRSN